MRPISSNRRKYLFRASLLLCVGSGLLAPLGARSSIEITPERLPGGLDLRAPILAPEVVDTAVTVVRDPFTPDRPQIVQRELGNPSAEIGMQVQQGAPIGIVLPPNRGAAGQAEFNSITIRAIIVGRQANALVEEGGSVRVVSVGDTIAGRRVLSIGAAGVRVAGGARYPLAEVGP